MGGASAKGMPRARAEYTCVCAQTFPGMIRQPVQSMAAPSSAAWPTATTRPSATDTSASTTTDGRREVTTRPPRSIRLGVTRISTSRT